LRRGRRILAKELIAVCRTAPRTSCPDRAQAGAKDTTDGGCSQDLQHLTPGRLAADQPGEIIEVLFFHGVPLLLGATTFPGNEWTL
jgi:hypothetical protein